MRALFLLVLAIIPNISLAEPIITDTVKVETLYNKVLKNQFYLKVGPGKFKIYYFEVGQAITPFYERNLQVKRFYKKDSKCFELTIFETMNIARKVGCYDKTKDLYLLGFEEFKAISIQALLEEGPQGFKTGEFSKSYELEAFVQTIDTYNMDRAVYGDTINEMAPRRKFKSYLKGFNEVILTKKVGLEILQNIELSVEKIGILNAKSTKSSNSIKVIPGGLIFGDGQGKIIVYNPVLPKPFGDYELNLNPKIPELLELLAEQSLYAPVCFRDNYVSPGPKDCHRMIFESNSLGMIKKVKIILIDFVEKKIKFI